MFRREVVQSSNCNWTIYRRQIHQAVWFSKYLKISNPWHAFLTKDCFKWAPNLKSGKREPNVFEFPFIHLRDATFKEVRIYALIFDEWNKNCFIFIFTISNRKHFISKLFRGLKQSLFLQKPASCLIMIWRKLDILDKKLYNFFITQ